MMSHVDPIPAQRSSGPTVPQYRSADSQTEFGITSPTPGSLALERVDSEHVRLRLTSRDKGQITVESKGFSTAANDDGWTVVSTGEVRIRLSQPGARQFQVDPRAIRDGVTAPYFELRLPSEGAGVFFLKFPHWS